MKKLFLFIVLSFLVIGFNSCSGYDDSDSDPDSQRTSGKISSTSMGNVVLHSESYRVDEEASKYDFKDNIYRIVCTQQGRTFNLKIHDLEVTDSDSKQITYSCSEISWGDYSTKYTKTRVLPKIYLNKMTDEFTINGLISLWTSEQDPHKDLILEGFVSFYR